MNKTFEWTRFCKVVRKDTNNIWQHFGLTMLIITLLPMAAWLLWWAINGVEYVGGVAPEVRWVMIACCASLASIMAPARMYRTCNLQKEGIYFAMLPASKLEKYLSMILICVIVCPLAVLFGGVVLDLFLTVLPFGPYDNWIWQTELLGRFDEEFQLALQEDPQGEALLTIFSPGYLTLLFLLSYLNSCAVFMFTATIFKKHKILQTILWLWAISFALNILTIPIMGFAMLDGDWVERFFVNAPERFARLLYLWSVIWNAVLAGVLFWWAGYRLKRMKY